MLFCNSGCIHSYYDNMRYTIYRWGFPYLDYSFDVLISWSCNQGCTAGFVVFAFIRFLFRFSVFLLLLYYIYGFTTCVLLHWSPAITTLYTTCFMPDITLELLYLTSWLIYSWSIRIRSYRIVSWWFKLFLFSCYCGQLRLCVLSQWKHNIYGI